MHAYNGDKESWKPLHYILDCYSKEDEAYNLGDSSSMNPKNRDLFAEVVETGKVNVIYRLKDGRNYGLVQPEA